MFCGGIKLEAKRFGERRSNDRRKNQYGIDFPDRRIKSDQRSFDRRTLKTTLREYTGCRN